MTPEGKRAMGFFCRAAALLVPMVAVPILTLIYLNWRPSVSLDDPNPAMRVAAVRSTGSHGDVDLLMRALQDEDADVRLISAMYLAGRREEAGPSVKALVALLKDKHEGIRREAITALSAIGAPAAPALVEALSDPDPRVRDGALDGLGNIGRPKEERLRSPEERALVISTLERLMRTDDDANIRQKARALLRYLRRQPRGEG
jgi:HEAT repeat protein